MLAQRVADAGSAVVVVGQSLDDRDETLSGLVAAVRARRPVAVAARLAARLRAGAARPCARSRRCAGARGVSLGDERLPLPAAHDEIRRLGETLNDMLARLRRSFERERRFVADASHELRTPLAVLKTELEAALRGARRRASRESLVAASRSATTWPARRGPARARPHRRGRAPGAAGDAEGATLLEGVRDRFADRAQRAGREILVEDGDARVHADPLRLRQALGNLVDNALRHGGGEIALRAVAEDGGVALEVSDAGAGFAPDIADRAFERFARGDAARTRGGTGLGLAIVRAIAEAHGGRATLEGATVRVWLPLSGPSQRALQDRRAMKKRMTSARSLAAAGALAAGGAAIAGAAGGDDDATDTAITGSALDRAEAAALADTGGGRVTETEVGDEESYYEVEVTRADGSQVDVQLDRDFNVVGSSADDERAGDD